MRRTAILLILFLAAACAPMQIITTGDASSSASPTPIVIASDTTPLLCPCPIGAIPSGPAQGTVSGGTPVICNFPAMLVTPAVTVSDSGTAAVQCPCPSGAFPPGQPEGGTADGTPVICNCPAILLPPTIPVSEVGTTSASTSPGQITLDDNGRTFSLHAGDSFLLYLGIDTFDWTVMVDHQDVLRREKNVMVIRGAQGIYRAGNQGQAILAAVGDPLCRKSVPACGAPSLLFKITVIVK